MTVIDGMTTLITTLAIVWVLSFTALQAVEILMNVLRTMIQAWGVNLGE